MVFWSGFIKKIKNAVTKERVDKLEQKINTNATNIELVEQDVETNTNNISNIKGNINSIVSNIGNISDDLTRLENNLTTTNNELDSLEANVNGLDARITEATNKANEANTKATSAEEQVTRLGLTVSSNTNKINTNTNKINTNTNSINDLRSSINNSAKIKTLNKYVPLNYNPSYNTNNAWYKWAECSELSGKKVLSHKIELRYYFNGKWYDSAVWNGERFYHIDNNGNQSFDLQFIFQRVDERNWPQLWVKGGLRDVSYELLSFYVYYVD